MDTPFEFPENEDRASVKLFEEYLAQGGDMYFGLEEIESIIEYYLEAGDLEKAKKACELGLENFPYSGDMWLEMAQVQFGLGNLDLSLEHVLNAENFLPGDEDVRLLKGNILVCQEKFDEGIDCLQQVFATTDDKSLVALQLGLAYLGKGDEDVAIEYFKEALKGNIENEETLFDLSDALTSLGELEKALPFFEAILDKDPYSAGAWFNLGVVYDNLEKHDEAIRAYDYATLIDDKYSSAWFNFGICYLGKDEYAKALDCFKKVLEIEGIEDPNLPMYLGQCYHKLDAEDKAVEYYQQAIKLDDKIHQAWYGLGVCLDEKEKWFESIHFFKKAYELDDENSVYAFSLASAEYKTGNIQSALEYFKRASELSPDDTDVWLDWSFIYFENEEIDLALSVIFDGIRQNPADASLYYRLTAYLMKAGKYKQAFTYLENALILDYNKHVELLEFYTDLETQKALMKVIDQFRDEDVR